jgi:long-chain acyl-CoA synthetase
VNNIVVAKLTDYLSPVKQFLFKLTKGRKIKKVPDSDKNIFWKDILKAKTSGDVETDRKVREMAVILYSGGTTGNPKGIMLSSYNINALATQIKYVGPMNSDDKMLSILPVFHGFGLAIGIHAVLTTGATSLLVPKFDPKMVASLIQKAKPQFVAGVPTLYEALLREPKVQKADFSSFKFMASGGDSLPSHTKRKFDEFIQKRGAKTHLREGYGLTESVTANCVMPENHYRKGSVGIPFPDMELKIVKPGTTEEAPTGEEGEICVLGPTVMLGYLEDPEENKKALQIHSDGRTWLHTSDMGRMDEDGFFYFSIRTKRIIKVSGMGVYPPQIEDALSSHPNVSLSCAIGVPDEYKMNRVKAYVVLHDSSADQKNVENELLEICKRDLNKWSVPTEFEFVDSLPLTRIGKVDFNKLEEEERAKAS